jgi:hypothetical protein
MNGLLRFIQRHRNVVRIRIHYGKDWSKAKNIPITRVGYHFPPVPESESGQNFVLIILPLPWMRRGFRAIVSHQDYQKPLGHTLNPTPVS